jgi:hypothetical protein
MKNSKLDKFHMIEGATYEWLESTGINISH